MIISITKYAITKYAITKYDGAVAFLISPLCECEEIPKCGYLLLEVLTAI